jgi:hypothetical protein
MLPAFQMRIIFRQSHCRISKPARLLLAGFQKLLGTTPRHLSFNRSKGFELTGFKKLLAISKAFGAEVLRTY